MNDQQLKRLELLPGWMRFVARAEKPPRKNNLNEWVEEAERLAKTNNNILPCSKWLRTNGYSGMAEAIRKNPEAYKHITQESKAGKTLAQWLVVAENLASEHGGVLPTNQQWLRDNKHAGLSVMLSKHHKAFAHLLPKGSESKKRAVKRKTNEEWLLIANQLAVNNILPRRKWLFENGYGGLYKAIMKNPHLFGDVKLIKRKLIRR